MRTLALVGTSIAFYDSFSPYNAQPPWCPPPIDGCDEVANSLYARIYNLPVGYYGVVFYLYMFGLAALLAFDPFSRALRWAAVGYAAVFSIYFMILQVAFIHAFYIDCLGSAVTTVLLLMAEFAHFRTTAGGT